MRSFVDHGHAVRLFCYDAIDVPAGVIRSDARQIVNADELRHYPSIAAFSDAFRYELLCKEGGWWADVDVLCLTDKLPDAAYAWAEQEPGVINGAVLKFPKGDGLLVQLAAGARKLSKQTRWGTIGPRLLSNVLHGCDPPARAGTTAEFYPLHWLEAPLLVLPEYRSDILRRMKQSTFLHLWSHVFEDIGIDLERPLRGSLMHDLVKPHSEQRATLWTQVQMRRAINQYWQQSWTMDRWGEVFGNGAKPPRVRYRLLRWL